MEKEVTKICLEKLVNFLQIFKYKNFGSTVDPETFNEALAYAYYSFSQDPLSFINPDSPTWNKVNKVLGSVLNKQLTLDIDINEKRIDINEILSIIVIKLDNLKLGLIVNEIQRVIPLRKKDIQPPSPLLHQPSFDQRLPTELVVEEMHGDGLRRHVGGPVGDDRHLRVRTVLGQSQGELVVDDPMALARVGGRGGQHHHRRAFPDQVFGGLRGEPQIDESPALSGFDQSFDEINVGLIGVQISDFEAVFPGVESFHEAVLFFRNTCDLQLGVGLCSC